MIDHIENTYKQEKDNEWRVKSHEIINLFVLNEYSEVDQEE